MTEATNSTDKPCIFCPACGHKPALSQYRYQIQERVDGRWRPVAGLVPEFEQEFGSEAAAQNAIDKLREYPEWTMAELRALPVSLGEPESAPIRYLQPVTVSGWYETDDGRWTEFVWSAGRLLVVHGREAVTTEERAAFKERDEAESRF